MRVVFNLLDADVGGGQRVAAGIAAALRDHGHTVGVLVPADGPALPWFMVGGTQAHFVDVTSLRRPWGIRAAAAAFVGYDLVYSHTSVPGAVLAGAAASRAQRPHVIHQHIYPHFSGSAPVRRVQRALYGRATRRAQVIAVARHVADAAVAAGAPRGRVVVIPNGVEIPAEPAPPRAGGTPRIGLLGRLDVQKGIDLFLDALELMTVLAEPALGSPLPEDDTGRKLHERAHALGVDVVAPATRTFLEPLDIFAAPSRYEGHPLTLMEAMALGKAVVATAIPGVTEMLTGEDAGLLVPPEDSAALAAALDALATDPELRARLGARARALVSARYSLPVVHARVIDVLEQAAATHRASV